MKYKEGDTVVIKGNDGNIKRGIIRFILPNTKMLMTPTLDWNGAAYIVDCNEMSADGIRYTNTIPFENIIRRA